ncbi:MAG: hypothetical protein AVDCRST_MAG78-313, partial [uncultured Rubrobacteraceae bacterium]
DRRGRPARRGLRFAPLGGPPARRGAGGGSAGERLCSGGRRPFAARGRTHAGAGPLGGTRSSGSPGRGRNGRGRRSTAGGGRGEPGGLCRTRAPRSQHPTSGRGRLPRRRGRPGPEYPRRGPRRGYPRATRAEHIKRRSRDRVAGAARRPAGGRAPGDGL